MVFMKAVLENTHPIIYSRNSQLSPLAEPGNLGIASCNAPYWILTGLSAYPKEAASQNSFQPNKNAECTARSSQDTYQQKVPIQFQYQD